MAVSTPSPPGPRATRRAGRLAAWLRSPGPVWTAVATALIVKLLVFALVYVSFEVVTNSPITGWRDYLTIWVRWDAEHYLKLAEHGYQATGPDRVLIVFYPLFPWLVRAAAVPLGDYVSAAFAVATVCSLAAAALMYALARLDVSEHLALRSVWFLFIFPTAYFLHAGYTEALFLMLVLGSVLAARRDHWPLAGVLGALAALTRMNGLLLLPVLAVEAWLAYRQGHRFRWAWLWIGVVGLGTLAYLGLNVSVFGDPFAFLTMQQANWARTWAPPWQGLMATWDSFFWRAPQEAQFVSLQELFFSLLGLAGTVAAFVWLRPSYGVWMAGNWLLFVSNSFIASVPRYTLAMFPLFILFALLAQRRLVDATLTTWSLLFLALFVTQFTYGSWGF